MTCTLLFTFCRRGKCCTLHLNQLGQAVVFCISERKEKRKNEREREREREREKEILESLVCFLMSIVVPPTK